MPIIKTERLTHLYSPGTVFEKAAVEDISLEIRRGEFLGIIGHTGSGKSTLIQHFNGLLRPSSGKVYIDGEDIWAQPKAIRKFRFKVGLVFQYPEYQLFEETVYKDVAFGPVNMGLGEKEVRERTVHALRLVGLPEEILEKSPFELSGGQKRRAAIAGVIAMEPEVLILDEPTAGLDPGGRDMILGMVKDYHRERKNTVLLVSHSMEDIAKYAPKVLVMNKAKVYAYDDVAKIFGKADQLERLGLSVPQITKICMKLSSMGYDIPPDLYTVEQAKAHILTLLGKGGGAGD
ncbi:MAG: energy-coupling factor transporter ATPase [Oscillospiraceae bacterium]|nr:energy-coupling factor transporter ATPase [Oscillospiraceae bacterium]